MYQSNHFKTFSATRVNHYSSSDIAALHFPHSTVPYIFATGQKNIASLGTTGKRIDANKKDSQMLKSGLQNINI